MLSKAKLLEIDGHGSGFDADTLDGKHGSEYAPASLGDKVNQLSNPNLLINTNFANPINQRNYVHGTNVTNKFTIDRWFLYGTGHILFGSNYIHLYNTAGSGFVYLWQPLEFPEKYSGDYVVTIRVNAPVGSLASVFISDQDSTWLAMRDLDVKGVWATYTFPVTIPAGKTALRVSVVTNTNLAIRYIKLEEGTIATSFIRATYDDELMACLYYFQKIRIVTGPPYILTASNLYFLVELRRPMRDIAATVTLGEAHMYHHASGEPAGFTYVPGSAKGTNKVWVRADKTNHGIPESSMQLYRIDNTDVFVDREIY